MAEPGSGKVKDMGECTNLLGGLSMANTPKPHAHQRLTIQRGGGGGVFCSFWLSGLAAKRNHPCTTQQAPMKGGWIKWATEPLI
jgi:hypothetical protein